MFKDSFRIGSIFSKITPESQQYAGSIGGDSRMPGIKLMEQIDLKRAVGRGSPAIAELKIKLTV